VPPIPEWSAIHPIVVHFPIGILAVAPLFVLLALIMPRHRGAFAASAFLLILLGTIGLMLAVSSGEAGEGVVPEIGSVQKVLHEHEEAGELARTLFIALTLVLALILALPRLRGARWRSAQPGMLAIYLVAYVAGLLVLVDAASHGGELVHEHGVRAGHGQVQVIGNTPHTTSASPAEPTSESAPASEGTTGPD
jgi:uncharacterized membrane protein